MREMTRTDDREILDAIYRQELALLGNGNLTDDSFKGAQRSCKETFYDLLGTYRPWEGANFLARKQKEHAGLSEEWDAVFGDHNDPEVQAEVERTAENMRQRAASTTSEVDEEWEMSLRLQKAQSRKD